MPVASPMRSRARRPACAPARSLLGGEGGFTLVEVTVGIFLVAVGLMAVASSFDVFRTLVTSSSNRNVAAHVADKQLEQLASVGWKDLELAATPVYQPDPKDPRSGVSPGPPPQYRADPGTPFAPLVIDTDANPAAIAPSESWSEAGVSGTIYRFITKGTDPGCGTTCPKRVTVAVTINRASGNPPDPVTASTVVSETQDKNADENASVPPPTPGPVFVTLFPTDTQASIGTRQEPTSDHVVHESNKFPDLMVGTPPPNPNDPADPPNIRLYSQEYRAVPFGGAYTPAGYPGGRVLEKEGNCDKYDDKKKVHWWVTKPLASTVTLTGNVGGTIFTQIAGETAGKVILCLTVYDVVKPLKPSGEFDGTGGADLVKLNGKDCAGQDIRIKSASDPPDGPEAFPDSSGVIFPREISLSGRFLGCGIASRQILAGHRLGIALTARDKRPKADPPVQPADIPASTAVVLYDHPTYPSTLGIETTTPFTP